jgi:predicted permease
MMRLYRALLHLYPASFRNEYGDEMARDFSRRLRDAGRPLGAIGVWLEALVDTLANALRVHRDVLAQDLRYTARSLRRSPGFTFTALVVTALGVGATTAAFSITDHVLLRPLPFKQPDRLVRLYQDQSFRGYARMELSPPNYRDWHQMATVFASMGAFTQASVNLVGQGEPERLTGTLATFEVLPMLGVAPALGRFFTAQEDQEGAAATVVLSHSLWRGTFGGDPGVIGRKVLLNDEPHIVIGVMPRGFYFPSRTTEFWAPMRFRHDDDYNDRTNYYLYGIARLRDGVSVDDARAELRVIAARLERQFPKENEGTSAAVVDLRTDLSRQARLLLVALFGASLCVLLIACTNLANLLLARALARRREVAVRAALGAGRERLVRQMLTESVLLACGGGIAGILIAIAGTPLAVRLVPNALPIAEMPAVNLRMLLFAGIVTLATGIAFGVLPALRAGQVDSAALAEGARSGGSRRAERVRSVLVVAEVTASVVLLIGTALLIRALWVVQRIDPGFDPQGVLTVRTTLPLPKYGGVAQRGQFYRAVLGDIEALPGVSGAAYISYLPMGSMRGGVWPISLDGRPPDGGERDTVLLRFVTPGFFSALRIPLRAGRDVDERDTQNAPYVAVVSESFVREHWPGESALGRRFFVGFRERTIVGVVGDIHVRGLERESEPQVYLPYEQVPDNGLIGYTPKDLVVRSSMPAGPLVAAVRSIIARADPQQPVSDVALYADVIESETAPRTAQLRVLAAFAAIALTLAGIGLHGLLAFIVSARTREIGVRIALGAASRDILRLVMGHGLLLATAGVAVGAALAYAAGRTMQSLLAGVPPSDGPAFIAACSLVLLVTILGTLVPARRAVRIDPLHAIRTE